jgi:hypothetical protein
MPRKSTDKVIEHRITLGDYERKEFKQTLDAYQLQKNINSAIDGAKIVAVGVGGYFLYKGLIQSSGIISAAWMKTAGFAESAVETLFDFGKDAGHAIINPIFQLRDRFLVDLGLGPEKMNTHWKYDLRYLSASEFQAAYGMSKPDFGFRMSQETTAENRQQWVNEIRRQAAGA